MQNKVEEKQIIVSPDMPLRPPTFGDWVECGEVSRLIRVASDTGEEAIEFRSNEAAVLRWIKRSTGLSDKAVVAMPSAVGRAIYARMISQIPAFAYAKPREGDSVAEVPEGLELTLKTPLPGHREQHTKLLFRNPTFGDVINAGDITTMRVMRASALGDTAPATEEIINAESVARWFQRLTGLPIMILSLLDYDDAWTAFAHLRPRISEIAAENFGGPSSIFGSAAA